MAGKMPEGLVGVLKGKEFIKPKKTSPKKELSPALAAAAKRRLQSKGTANSDGGADAQPGPAMSYLPGVVK